MNKKIKTVNDWFFLFKSKKFTYAVIIAFASVVAFILGKKILKYYGAKPSKRDKRDYRIAAAPIQFPFKFELPLPKIKDQGATSSCVAHSVSYLSEAAFSKTGDYNLDRFSVGFIYGYRPAGYYNGEGMYPREAMKTLKQVGNVRHRDFPYNEEVPIITKKVMANFKELSNKASFYKVPVYFQLKNNEEIKTCLMKYGPVSIMYPVHEEFMNPTQGKIEVKGLKKFQGYHQVSIYGWEGDSWLMVNSWSQDWGNNGTALVSFDYPWSEAWGVSTDSTAVIETQKKTSFLKRIFGIG